MIIRSQDKKNITNFNQITDIQVQKNNDKYDIQVFYPFSIDDGYSQMRLGAYSTEEKAIKVLDMIEDSYRNMAFTDRVVFHTPQDSEV